VSAGRRAEKAGLRKSVLARRDALSAELHLAYSARITSAILALNEYRDARFIAAYMSFGSEFDTSAFIRDILARGKQLALPRIDAEKKNIEMRSVADPDRDLVAGMWGIREPAERCPQITLNTLDFVLVPGVAFTGRRERLGYGKGFYDRLIAGLNPECKLVAAAFSCQVVERMPTTKTDQRVHLVVTEAGQFAAA
jgi:5,10-methenyltetrahydrofolate synthetase